MAKKKIDSYSFNKDRKFVLVLASPDEKKSIDSMIENLDYRKIQDGYREIFYMGLREFEKKHNITR